MRRLRVTLAVGVAAVAAATTSAASGQGGAGFQTSQDAMLTCETCDEVTPIITVGETMPGGYRFEAIPDGIALRARGNGRLDLFVNHETSTVPFPFNPAVADLGESQNDFVNSEVSHLILNQRSKGVLSAKKVIPSSANYQRFCTNYMATEAEGFDRPVLFANEEAQDWVFRSGTAWPGTFPPLGFIPPGTSGAEQAGVTAAYDVQRNEYKTIYGLGRLNHENTVAIPVDDGIAVLTTDDTFFTTPVTNDNSVPARTYNTPAWSQLYMYLAEDVDDLMNDGGDLYAFVGTGKDDYYDFAPGDTAEITGHFIKVPKHIATGKHPTTGGELLSTSTGAGYTDMLPPPNVSGPPPDGPQWVLDQWGNANINAQDDELPEDGENVFRFVRLEDIAYDKRPGMSNHVYIADTGRAQTGTPQQGRSTNGRVWKFVLDPSDPTQDVELSILIEGDDKPVAVTNSTLANTAIHQPDNMETTANGSLFIQEDPSTNNQWGHYTGVGAPISDTNRTTARIWRYDLDTSTLDVVARVASNLTNTMHLGDEVNDDDPADNPPFAGGSFPLSPGNLGAWESSGIVDASSVYGDGALFVTVQAHTFWVDAAAGPDRVATNGQQDFFLKREGGQLLLIRNEDW